jgi:hypothetical protein
MENEYAKNLELENAAIRVAMNRMEDEIARLHKELEYTVLTKEDLLGMSVTNVSFEIPTTQIQFGGKTYHFAGCGAGGTMTISIDRAESAVKLRKIIDEAKNVK